MAKLHPVMNNAPDKNIALTADELVRQQRARLLFRSQHRGMKEMDVVLGRFAVANIPSMSEADLAEYETLLALPDLDMWEWLLGIATPPPSLMTPLLHRLMNYNVSHIK
jgi:antitoxin CptB